MPELAPEHHRKLTESSGLHSRGVRCGHSRVAAASWAAKPERAPFDARARLDEAARALLPALRRQFQLAQDPLEYALRAAAADCAMGGVMQLSEAAAALDSAWRTATQGRLWCPGINRVRQAIAAARSPLYLMGPCTPAVWDCMLVELLTSNRELQVATRHTAHLPLLGDHAATVDAAVSVQHIASDGPSRRAVVATLRDVIAASDLVIAKGLEWLEQVDSHVPFHVHVFSADQYFVAKRLCVSAGASVAIEGTRLQAVLSHKS